MNEFRRLIAGTEPVYAPLVFNPVSALLAKAAGFRALYLGGGSMGYIKAGTEANLSVTEMAQAALDIRTVCPLPLILDGAGGWGAGQLEGEIARRDWFTTPAGPDLVFDEERGQLWERALARRTREL